MATISLRVSDKQKNIISNFAKKNYKTMSQFVLESVLEKIEDHEDYLLGESRMLDENNIVGGDLKELAKELGINYDEL